MTQLPARYPLPVDLTAAIADAHALPEDVDRTLTGAADRFARASRAQAEREALDQVLTWAQQFGAPAGATLTVRRDEPRAVTLFTVRLSPEPFAECVEVPIADDLIRRAIDHDLDPARFAGEQIARAVRVHRPAIEEGPK